MASVTPQHDLLLRANSLSQQQTANGSYTGDAPLCRTEPPVLFWGTAKTYHEATVSDLNGLMVKWQSWARCRSYPWVFITIAVRGTGRQWCVQGFAFHHSIMRLLTIFFTLVPSKPFHQLNLLLCKFN